MIAYLVPLIVVMSCLVAYLGDYLGRRLGKRRLTVLGLRPKHTAILITVLTGMMISSATLGAVMMIDRDARRAILQFPQIIQDLSTARREVMQAQRRALSARMEMKRDEQNLKESAGRYAAARIGEQAAEAQLHSAEKRLKSAGVRLRLQEKALASARNLRRDLEVRNQTLDRETASQRQQVAGLNHRIPLLESQIQDDQRKVHEADADVERHRSELVKISSEMQALSEQFDRARIRYREALSQNSDLNDQNEALLMSNSHLQAENSSLVAQNEQIQGALRQAGEQLEQARLELAHVEGLSALAIQDWKSSLRNATVYEPGQLIAEATIDCRSTTGEIEEQVRQLLSRAEADARSRGAGAPEDPANVAPLPSVLRLADPTDPDLSSEEVLSRFATNLARKGDIEVVRVESLLRFFSGNEVVAGLSQAPFRKIYSRGELIASTTLDGDASERQLRNALFTFLRTRVGTAARGRGMLPDAHGDISTDMLDKVVDLGHKIHLAHRDVTVEATAAEDTWCSQPLDIEFRIHRLT